MGRVDDFARNSRLAVVGAEGGPVRSLTDAFDENPYAIAWIAGRHLLRGDAGNGLRISSGSIPTTLEIARLDGPDASYLAGATLTADAKRVAFVAQSPTGSGRGLRLRICPWTPRTLTRMTEQVEGFVLGTREVISWKSKDGTPIEGVLIKPADFDPGQEIRPSLRHPRRADGGRPSGPLRRPPLLSRRTSGPPAAPSSSR